MVYELAHFSFIYLVCPSGYFGMNCRGICTGQCIRDEPCDHVSGICLSGCEDGYIGAYCNSCMIRTYFAVGCVRFPFFVSFSIKYLSVIK